jgi:hypothetical protein
MLLPRNARIQPPASNEKKKKLTEKDREILQERSELCKGDTREGCLYGLLLRPRGAAKCTCTTYNQKLGMVL